MQTCINTNQMMHTADRRIFITEASDVGIIVPTKNILVTSARTGNKTNWFFHSADVTPEGETTGWRYRPTDLAVKKYPRLHGYSLLIIND